MKKKMIVTGACLIAAIIFAGCATPIFTPATPITPAYTNYVPNSVATQISEGIAAAAPVIPAPYGMLLTAISGLIAAGATTLAAYKNKQLAASNAAGATMAATIVNSGPAMVAQAHTNAAADGTSASVATHIADAQP